MEIENTLKNNKGNKASRLKYKISISVFLLLVISVFAFISWEQNKPDKTSAAVIRNVAAMQLGKDPNELTDEDFASITELTISSQKLHDIKLIKKCTNLEELQISQIKFPEVPKWMKILSKIGLIDITKRYALDLGPVEKLENLKTITFFNTPIRSFEPLSKINQIKTLSLDTMEIHDFESLKKLKNTKTILLIRYSNLTKSQIDELKKALPETQVSRWSMRI